MDLNSRQKKDLLTIIAEKAGSNYLSDLRNEAWWPEVQKVIGGICAADYSIKEWNDAVRYIADGEMEFREPREAKEFLEFFKKETDKE